MNGSVNTINTAYRLARLDKYFNVLDGLLNDCTCYLRIVNL